MKANYSVMELLEMELETLPKTKAGLGEKIKRESWPFIEIACKGGRNGKRREYAPPPEIMAQIKEREISQLMDETAPAPLPALADEPETGLSVAQRHAVLTDRQKQVESARMGVLSAIDKLMDEAKTGKLAAITTLLTQARLPEYGHIAKMFELARDGRGAVGDLPSVRTINRWFAARESGELVPKIRLPDMALPEWGKLWLACWQNPQKRGVEQAYREFFVPQWQQQAPLAKMPSVHQARRLLEKLGNVSREKGRLGPRALKNLKGFKVREFLHLDPAEIYTADGHTFDAEVLHPDSGKPFRPEITTVADVATRKIVGWSVDLAESGHAVLAAISHACGTNGIPAIFYVDNGKGYKNSLMTDEATGLMGRIGTTMMHSLPYSSKARGVIERLHQTVWVDAAKSLASYMGEDMDDEARQEVHKASRKAGQVALKTVPALANIASLQASPLPTWRDFVVFCAQRVEWYNNRPHRSLPKVLDVSGKRRHMTPNEMWALKVAEGAEILRVDEADKQTLFMPQKMCTVERERVRLHRNYYYSTALQEYNGERMRVAYDIHDADFVWIYDDAGRFVAKAEWNANNIDYMPKTVREQAKEKRVDAQLKRIAKKGADIEAARPVRVIEHQTSVNLGGVVLNMAEIRQRGEALAAIKPRADDVDAVVVERPSETEKADDGWQVPATAQERFELYQRLQHAADLPEKAATWVRLYPGCVEYRALSKRAQAM